MVEGCGSFLSEPEGDGRGAVSQCFDDRKRDNLPYIVEGLFSQGGEELERGG